MAMVPEGRIVFSRMTVLENLEMGAFHRNDKEGIAMDIERVYVLFPRLKNGEGRYRARCRAASSRCWPWAGR